jgi:hypothetical protein
MFGIDINGNSQFRGRENEAVKKNDLEDRTFDFAENVRAFVRPVPRTTANIEDSKPVIRSSGSVGANYIEANESIGKKIS